MSITYYIRLSAFFFLVFFPGGAMVGYALGIMRSLKRYEQARERFEQQRERVPPLTYKIMGGEWWLLMGDEPVRKLDADEITLLAVEQEESQE